MDHTYRERGCDMLVVMGGRQLAVGRRGSLIQEGCDSHAGGRGALVRGGLVVDVGSLGEQQSKEELDWLGGDGGRKQGGLVGRLESLSGLLGRGREPAGKGALRFLFFTATPPTFLVAQQLYRPVCFFLFFLVHKSHGQTHKLN